MRGFSPFVSELGDKHSEKAMSPPDVTFIFADDVVEWDAYLSRQFEGSGAVLQHEQVEKMTFPLGCTKTSVFSDARVVLIILSPALVEFLDKNAYECFQFTKLLKPRKTIAMICGASPSSIAGIKNVLVSYDEWRHLEARDKDINMVRNVVEMMQETLARSKECERINKPKYKLIPRKIQEGNGKVYVLLTKPLDNNARIRITLEANGAREIPVKKRNPYTLTFIIPDELIHVQNMVNVHVWNGEDFMGVSPVKCVSKMGELYGLLNSVASPYEFLRSTLGVSSLTEVDNQLTNVFLKNLPIMGLNLLQNDNKFDRFNTKEEFPTLLHFAARYGLFRLVHELFECPGVYNAVIIKNCKGLTPAQLANNEGHNEIAAAIDDFVKTKHIQEKENVEKPVPCQTLCDSEVKKSNPLDDYDIPAQPVPVLHLPTNRMVGRHTNDRECDYLQMKASMKENIEPLQNIGIGGSDKLDNLVPNSACNAEKVKLSLLESQAKLIEIMEAYKKGASLTEVEKMHNEWKTFYQVSDMEAKSTLDGLRNLYAKAQKAKMLKKHSSSFSELRQFLNSKWRRKDSVDIKGMSRRNSKESNICEKISTEPENVRPVSTLSVLSNTSSSSGSSFDRLSTTSAGSDSGHHSDFGDDRNNKFRERYESRYQQYRKTSTEITNAFNLQKTLTLNSKPPAPPPRPMKTQHYGSLENCKQTDIPHYSTTKKLIVPSFEEALKMLDYVPPSVKSSSLSSDFRSGRKTSLSSIDFSSLEDPNENYDRPPPPRPSLGSTVPMSAREISQLTKLCFPSGGQKTDYDRVPPPLPISPPPQKLDNSSCDIDQSYDIPPPFPRRSNSVSSDYDVLPKTFLLNNTDIQPTCTCQVAAPKNNLSSIKSCCVGNKLSSLKQVGNLPSVPSFDVVDREKTNNVLTKTRPVQRHQYTNVCLKSPIEAISDRDSIPEEIAPPPPIIEDEAPEEHYKMVGTPTPVPTLYTMS